MAQTDTKRLVVELPSSLKREIEVRAAANRRSIKGEVQTLLEKAMTKETCLGGQTSK